MSYIARVQDGELAGFLKDKTPFKDVLLVEGARQVGKTTLVEHALSSLDFPVISVNLEKKPLLKSRLDACREFSEFQELLTDEFGFDPGRPSALFIDESQESARLGSFVRFMKESWRRTSVVLSGSTLARLFRPGIRFPVGRVRRLLVTPFTFTEFLQAAGRSAWVPVVAAMGEGASSGRHVALLQSWDDYLEAGGLPAVVTDRAAGRPFRRRRDEILADYEQDFNRIFGEESLALVKGCFRSVAHFVGSPSKNTTVASAPTTAVNHRINDIFARLEEWHLVLKSSQRSPSPEHSYDYHPKRYLFDSGLLKHLREGGIPSIKLLETLAPSLRIPLGGLIENQVAVDIARSGLELAGWKKTPSGGEIDFVVKREGRAFPLECKAALRVKGSHFAGIVDYMDLYGLKTGFLVSGAPFEAFRLKDGRRIVNLPFYASEKIPAALERFAEA